MRIRDAQSSGRRVVLIRVGPAVLMLDDLEDVLSELERRTGETAELTIDQSGPWSVAEIAEIAGYQVTGRPVHLTVWSAARSHMLAWVVLARDISYVEVDRALPGARETAVALAEVIEKRRSFVPYLVDRGMYLYTFAPPLFGAFIAVVAMMFGGDLDVWGVPVALWGPVVVVLAMGHQFLEYRRRYGGGVWLVSGWREGRPR